MKKLIPIFLIYFFNSLILNAQVSNGLVGHYNFNGNANDISTSGNNGTVVGATLTSDKNGSSNSAYNFDGNDYINLNAVYNSQNRSVSVWFIATENTNSHIIYSSDNKDLNFGMTALYIRKINNQNKLLWNISDILDTTNITLDVWHHAIITVSSTTVKVYLDCSLIGTYTMSNTNYHSTDLSSNDKVGTSRANNQFFVGKIDELRLYNRALTTSEVDTLCHQFNTSIKPVKVDYNLNFDIYPNPSNGVFNINISTNQIFESHKIEIYNSIGQLVMLKDIENLMTEVNISEFNNGTYIILLFNSNYELIGSKKILVL